MYNLHIRVNYNIKLTVSPFLHVKVNSRIKTVSVEEIASVVVYVWDFTSGARQVSPAIYIWWSSNFVNMNTKMIDFHA